ncbi:histidine kinase [Pandoraea thiooxydans]|uniref:Histidine kinase domain-containing protein n=1 Tax=Pandoraea thiooxydans TaxID=445709 RepID=A0A0U4DE78_9BURK|nr:sensor histidine kinase [Pandoraea thiooxydans]ALX34826.1 hypothetical protein ABW99_17520 [Pandoraea thiooxydans]APR97477.1 histidine kinase [Pandoraea thiooxydans]
MRHSVDSITTQIRPGTSRRREVMHFAPQQINAARDAERTRIGRELHDVLGAHLTALRLTLELVRRQAPDGNSALSSALESLELGLADTQTAVSTLAHDLHPPELRDGLSMALRAWVRQFERRTALPCAWECDDAAALDALEPATAAALFRITQEALNNAAKHARATQLRVALVARRQSVTLTVADNGRGIPAGARRKSTSLGLKGMQERCISLNGTFRIENAQPHGTAVRVTLPRRAGSATLS